MSPTTADRLAGAVWGHLVGDALGVPYEFKPASAIKTVEWGARGTHQQPPGTWSDDGGLMLALLDSLLSAGFDPEDQGRRFLAWYHGPDYKPGARFDVGGATAAALGRLRSGTPASEAGGVAESDNGNGSLMRILPIALVDREIPIRDLIERARVSSSITHRHPRSQLVCAVYCCLARDLLEGRDDLPASLDRALADVGAALDDRDELDAIARYPNRTGSGYVVDCFWSAYEALLSAHSYEEAVLRAIRYGNDTDTTACVAGGLAGIRWGVQGIPEQWLKGMRGRNLVELLVARLIGD